MGPHRRPAAVDPEPEAPAPATEPPDWVTVLVGSLLVLGVVVGAVLVAVYLGVCLHALSGGVTIDP